MRCRCHVEPYLYPNCFAYLAVEGIEGSHEFLLIDDFSGRHGQWVKTNSFTTIDDGKLFAPGNLRGTQVCMLLSASSPGFNRKRPNPLPL